MSFYPSTMRAVYIADLHITALHKCPSRWDSVFSFVFGESALCEAGNRVLFLGPRTGGDRHSEWRSRSGFSFPPSFLP